MSKVFVVDTNKQPLSPVHPAHARKLLSAGKAAVYRSSPFTKRLAEAPGFSYGVSDCEYFDISLKNAHSAMGDVLATYQVLNAMAKL